MDGLVSTDWLAGELGSSSGQPLRVVDVRWYLDPARRGRDAWRAGRCRRETPIALVDADGTLLEGVLDLAFEDDEGWTVVDFKTETEIGPALPRYRRQLGLYAAVVARATGKIARGVLMRL